MDLGADDAAPAAPEPAPTGAAIPAAPQGPRRAPWGRASNNLVLRGCDLGLMLWLGSPMTDEERSQLAEDMGAVAAKYNLTNIRFAEELQLLGTVGEIVVPRLIAKAMAGGESDSPVLGQEGVRENSGATQAGVATPQRYSEAAGILA